MIETPVGCEEVCGVIGGELCLYTTIGYPFCLWGLDEHGCPWICDQLGY